MASKRRVRRTAGLISCYFSDALIKLAEGFDGRATRGRRWKSGLPLLKAAMLGVGAGCKGTAEVEEMTEEMFKSVRKLVGIARRVPDTTMRDFLCKGDPEELSNLLYIVGYDAWRRKALRPREDIDIPFAVISMDGKYPSIRDTGNNENLQVHHDEEGNATHGLLRTVTSTLITAQGRPILGAVPVRGDTNEQGSFKKAFGDNVRIYGRLFKVVTYDAGATSRSNADAVRSAGKHYLFQIADPRWVMYQTVALLFDGKSPDVVDEEIVSSNCRVVRELTVLPIAPTRKNLTMWKHTKTILRVHSRTYENGQLTGTKTRYFVTSMEHSALRADQWLKLVVLRWGVETSHQILDTAFEEDNRPWITEDARGALVVQLLRRIVYTIMTLYKSCTIRSEEERDMPWRRYLEWVRDLLKWPNAEELVGLRSRKFAVPRALA